MRGSTNHLSPLWAKKYFSLNLVNTLTAEHILKITKNLMKKKQICELLGDVWAKPKRHQRHFFGLYFIRIYCSIERARSFCPSKRRRCSKFQFFRRGRNPLQITNIFVFRSQRVKQKIWKLVKLILGPKTPFERFY